MKSFCGWVGAIGILGSIGLGLAVFGVHPLMQFQVAMYAAFVFSVSLIIAALGELIELLQEIRDRLPAAGADATVASDRRNTAA